MPSTKAIGNSVSVNTDLTAFNVLLTYNFDEPLNKPAASPSIVALEPTPELELAGAVILANSCVK